MTKKKKRDKIDTQGMGGQEFHPEWQFYKIAPDPSQFDSLPRVTYDIDSPLPRLS